MASVPRWHIERHGRDGRGVLVADRQAAAVAKFYGPEAEANARLLIAVDELRATLGRVRTAIALIEGRAEQ